MDNYVKGEEKDIESSIPFDEDVILNVPVLKVKTNTKVHNLCGYAEKLLASDTCRKVLFVGVGNACSKTISCAEVLKRRQKYTLHQISKAQFKRIEEFWNPLEKGLDRLKVYRDIPAIYILLSKDVINQDDPSYQPAGEYVAPFCEQRKPFIRNQKQRKKSESQSFYQERQSTNRRRENIWKRPNKKEKTKQ